MNSKKAEAFDLQLEIEEKQKALQDLQAEMQAELKATEAKFKDKAKAVGSEIEDLSAKLFLLKKEIASNDNDTASK